MTTDASGDTPPWQPSAAWLEEQRRRQEAAAGEEEAEAAPPPTIGELEQTIESLRWQLALVRAQEDRYYRSCIRLQNENHVLLLRAGMASVGAQEDRSDRSSSRLRSENRALLERARDAEQELSLLQWRHYHPWRSRWERITDWMLLVRTGVRVIRVGRHRG